MSKPISLSAVLADLKNGMTRKAINEKYELNPLSAKALWGNEKLKNKKPAKYVLDIEIVDDVQVEYLDEDITRHPKSSTIKQ
jgi:hypothetical protein